MKSNTSKKTRNVGGKNMGKFGKDTSIPRKKHKATKSMVEDEEKKETPTKSTQAAAAKIPSKDIRTSPTDNDASQHPPYVGKRFAKRFDDGQIYYGDIKEMYPPDTTETRETLWYIQFDDDDSAIMGFSTHQKPVPRATRQNRTSAKASRDDSVTMTAECITA